MKLMKMKVHIVKYVQLAEKKGVVALYYVNNIKMVLIVNGT
jgi:hypothetical protein